jgi:hypothetical protein
MAETLHEAIVAHLKLRFTIPERLEQAFNTLISENIKNASQLNRVSFISITKQFRKDLEKDDWGEIKYIFKGVFVLIIRDYKSHLMMENEEEFVKKYPEFVECSIEERKLLLEFRNMMVSALQLVDPRNHKGELMTLVGHLCGTVVVTGGGQTAATDRRVLIYERETGILPRKLPERRRKIDKVLLPWTVSANQYIPLPGKVNRSDPSVSRNEIAPADVFALAKKGRFSLPDTKSLLKCADSFWNYHRSLMEANQDIPMQPVAVGSIADVQKFPSHDIFYTPPVTVNPNGTTNTAKLRSFFANLPKIEGVFAPVVDPSAPKESTVPAHLKPGMRETQENRRQAKERDAASQPVRDYHRVSSRAMSGRAPRGKVFGRPIAPPPHNTVWQGPLKRPDYPAPPASSASGFHVGGLTTTESGDPEGGSSCDASVRSLSEGEDNDLVDEDGDEMQVANDSTSPGVKEEPSAESEVRQSLA